jgi:hypothetical protein
MSTTEHTVSSALLSIPNHEIENAALELLSDLEIPIADAKSNELRIVKKALWGMLETALWQLVPMTIIDDSADDEEVA